MGLADSLPGPGVDVRLHYGPEGRKSGVTVLPSGFDYTTHPGFSAAEWYAHEMYVEGRKPDELWGSEGDALPDFAAAVWLGVATEEQAEKYQFRMGMLAGAAVSGPGIAVAVQGAMDQMAKAGAVLAAEGTALYRGVPEGTARGDLAKQGYAKPRGTTLDPHALRQHVLNEPVSAGVTSWTPDRSVARRFSGSDGTILEVDAKSVADRVVQRPDVGKYASEREVLLKGLIKATPTKP